MKENERITRFNQEVSELKCNEQFICDIEKGTRCKDSFPSYKDGKCHNCGGQAN